MFDLEQSITRWREQMLAAGITPVALDELENHLREEHARLVRSGVAEPAAFDEAAASLGPAELLKKEFMKTNAESSYGPLAWSAWSLFVVSFFCPAYGTGWGWQCAWLSVTAPTWSDFWHGNTAAIHLGLLTLANLLMLASPALLIWSGRNPRALNFLRITSVIMLVLVWSYIARIIASDGIVDLRIGCWLWTISFLPLCLCTFGLRVPAKISTSHV